MTQQVIYAFLITLAAGLATGIGSVIAFMTKRTNRRFLAFSLGLSAGVMIYVSFMEMLYSARVELAAMRGEQQGALITAAAFFGGMLIAYLIDRAVPEAENPHELHSFEELEEDSRHNHRLHRMGLLTALAAEKLPYDAESLFSTLSRSSLSSLTTERNCLISSSRLSFRSLCPRRAVS